MNNMTVIFVRPMRYFLCLPLMVVLAGGCQKKADAPARPPTVVRTAKATSAVLPVMMNSFGRLRALQDVDITPQISGRILEAPFKEGALVEQGSVLFRIEADIYQAKLDQAAAQVASATASLALKKATLERNRQLLDQSLISQEDYDKLVLDVDTAQAQLDQHKAAHAEAVVNLNYCTITAPVTAHVGKRLVDPGNFVSAGGATLVNLRAMDPLYLDFTLSESYLPALRKAMSAGNVEVLVAAESVAGEAGLFGGELSAMDNAVNTQSGTIGLRATVSNPDLKLWPGQFVYAFPVLDTLTNAVIVPQSAVTDGKDGPYAFVVEENKVVLRMVERGPVVSAAVVVEKGIDAGDVVVTEGQMGLWPGAPVQIKSDLEDAEKAKLDKAMRDPGLLALVRVLSAKGETPEQVAIVVGIPVENVVELMKNIEE